MEPGQQWPFRGGWRRLWCAPVLGVLLLHSPPTGAFLSPPTSRHTANTYSRTATPPVCEQWSPVWPQGTARTGLQAALREESEEGQSLGRDVLKLLDDVDRLQNQAFREVGVLGQPVPEDLITRLTAQGRIGTTAERAALSSACSAGSRGGELAVEALRLRVRAKRLRAEADLAEAQLAHEKLNGTMRALLVGVTPRDLLTDTPPPQVDGGAFELARQAYASLLGVSLAPPPPPLDAVALPASDKDKDDEDSSLIEGQRPVWAKREYWDDDMPDLSVDSRPPPNRTPNSPRDKDKDKEEEDGSLMRLGGGPIPRGRASEDRDLMSYRVKQEFLKELQKSSPMEENTDLSDNPNNSSSPWRLLSTLQDESVSAKEDDEEYFKILGSPTDMGAAGNATASPLELEGVLYELEGTDVPLAGAPDVSVRKIRRKEVSIGTSFNKTMGLVQRLLNVEDEEEAQRVLQQMMEQEEGSKQDKVELMKSLGGEDLLGGLGGSEGSTGGAKVRDQLLEQFLQEQFEVPPVALEAEDGEKLRTQVFGKDAGGAFKVQQVIDFDNVYNIFVGEAGSDTMASATLLDLLNKRLEFFQLQDKVSLFLLRFPPETLYDVEDLAYDAALNMDMDDLAQAAQQQQQQKRQNGQQPELDEETGLPKEEEIVSPALLTQLLGLFFQKIVTGRFAVLAVSKPPPDFVVETSVLSDPVIIGASLACGSIVQLGQALQYISPELQQALDTDLGAFLEQAPALPQVTQGVPPVLVPFLFLAVVHELAHTIVAKLHKVPIGVSTPVIDPWLGYWGSLTPFPQYPPSRRALFDISAAGPLLGSLSSYSALSAGLWLTKLGVVPQWAPLVPLTYLKQSVFIASLTNTILPGAFASVDPLHATLALHPLALAGIWGVTINALSLLPLGRQDGARMVEALVGKRSASFASSMTFWGLIAAGVGQGRLDLLFGGLVHRLFWSRRVLPCVDESLEMGGERRFLGVIALMLMLGALLPATSDMFELEPYLLNNL